jgi:site-specific DNA-adenine methylase
MRFNSKGDSNIPFGNRYFNQSMQEDLIQFKKHITNNNSNITTSNLSYKDVEIKPNSFLYFDPPYRNGTATYNENGGWGLQDV